VVVLKIDLASGAVTPTGQSVAVPTPVCIRFVALD
jgi:6-phosphogluconolactonase (cycloisomerase 2 family)